MTLVEVINPTRPLPFKGISLPEPSTHESAALHNARRNTIQVVANVFSLVSRQHGGFIIPERRGPTVAVRHFFLHPYNPLVFHIMEEVDSPSKPQLVFNIVKQPALRAVLEAKSKGSMKSYQELLVRFMEPSQGGQDIHTIKGVLNHSSLAPDVIIEQMSLSDGGGVKILLPPTLKQPIIHEGHIIHGVALVLDTPQSVFPLTTEPGTLVAPNISGRVSLLTQA